MLTKLKIFIKAHKIISLIAVVVVGGGGYYWYSAAHVAPTVTKYVVENATQGTIVASVSGSGQVQAVTSIDVKPQTTENVTRVYVKPGDHVAAGQLLVQLDTTNEAKALKQAQLSMQSAQIALAKLQQVSTTTLQQDMDQVVQGQESLANASTTLVKDYQAGFDTIAASFTDFQNLMISLQNFNTGTDINKAQENPDAYINLLPSYLQAGALPYRNNVQATFTTAVTVYGNNLIDYHAVNRNSPPATIDALLGESFATAKDIGDAVKAVKDLLNYVVDNYPSNTSSTVALPSITNTFQTSFGNYTNTANGDIANLSNQENTIVSDKTSINDQAIALNEKQSALATLQAGPDPLDVQSQQISIQNQELALQTAQQNLDYDSIRAPIDGTVSAVAATVGVTAPSPAVSIVGDGDQAQLTLNEVDAAKIAVGDKATLAFDALPNLSLAGTVTELDPVGTVSQGVVSYNVKIGFTDTTATSTPSQVKPGMSVTANIVSQVHQDVVVLPNGAVKTQGTTKYVLEPATPLSADALSASANGGTLLTAAPQMVPITVGLSNGTETEITSGVNVGDQVITQTITNSGAKAAASTNTNALRALGGAGGFGGGGGGGVRVVTGGGGATTGK